MTALPNPEADWEQPPWGHAITLAAIQERIGPIEETPHLLPGGQANVNLRLCASRVLRIYMRDPKASGKEAALLRRAWRRLRVPRVLARGADYLLLENVSHRPLEDGPAQGEKAGRALAEIHSKTYPASGVLDSDLGLDLDRRVPDFVQTLRELVAGKPRDAFGDLRDGVACLLDRLHGPLSVAAGPPVLLHGDFKPSNLFECGCGELLVLDWESASAGPALMDVGQLLRWSPPEPFVAAFESAYRAAGGRLAEGWRRFAKLLDLANLVDLLGDTTPGSRRAQDLRRLIEHTVAVA